MLITRRFHFEAAHFLSHHKGKCKRMHGHRWDVEVTVEGEMQGDPPMVMDFGELREIVDKVIEYLDHSALNVQLSLSDPTAEILSLWLFNEINPQLPFEVSVKEVRVYESPDSWATADRYDIEDCQKRRIDLGRSATERTEL